MAKGKWMLSSISPNDVLNQEKENQTNGKATCQFLRNESLSGEAAAVYSMRRESEILKMKMVRFGSPNGRALRKEVDVD